MYHRHCLYYAVSCSRVGIGSDLHSIILLGFQLLNDMLYHRSSGRDGKKKKKILSYFFWYKRITWSGKKMCGIQVLKNREFHKLSDSGTDMYPDIYQVWKRLLRWTLVVKNQPASAGDLRNASLVPGSRRSPGGGHDTPFQYSCLENPMDSGAWRVIVHKVTQSQTKWK